MPGEDAVVVLVVAAAAVVMAAARGIGVVRARIAIRQRFQAGQASLADNTVVTVTGTVRAIGDGLRAPLSGKRCVLHRSTARVLHPRRHGGRVWATAHARCAMVRFELETHDGKVIVDGDTAEVTLRPAPVIPRDLDRERAFLHATGVATTARHVSCEEVVIEPGMKVAVHGIARYERSPAAPGEAGFRDAPAIVRLVGHPRHPLTIGPA